MVNECIETIFEQKKTENMETKTIIIDGISCYSWLQCCVVYFNELRFRSNNKFMKIFIFLRMRSVEPFSSIKLLCFGGKREKSIISNESDSNLTSACHLFVLVVNAENMFIMIQHKAQT